jgi:hypothetical protein
MHFIPVPFPQELADDYLPTDLTHEDYPDLVPAGESVQTIADQVVLIGYNWAKNTDRFQRVQRFVQAFFPKIAEFRKPPNHPKWREVNLAVKLKNWKRFEPAEEWLAANNQSPAASNLGPDNPDLQANFKQFIASQGGGAQRGAATPAQNDQLFHEFLNWRQSRQPH